MTFPKLRPYPSQVVEILVGTGLVPITNEACTYLANKADADTIFGLMLTAAAAAQGSNSLGIPNPPPDLAMTSGLAANDLRDLITGETQIAYNSPDAPRAYCVRGTVIIPNQEAPNGPPKATLTIDSYVGRLAAAALPSSTKLVMSATTGEFSWV